MSVATEITRIQGAKADLKTSIEAKGVTVPSETLISGYAALVDQIATGGLPQSNGLVDLEISTGNQLSESFNLEYKPTYLLQYRSDSDILTRNFCAIAYNAYYPNITWSCNNASITISGYSVTTPSGFSGDVTFTATWTDYLGETRTTSKTINIKCLQVNTIRFEFSLSTYSPTSGSWPSGMVWTKVQGITENQWDCRYSVWSSTFRSKFKAVNNFVKVVGGYVSESLSSCFEDCTSLTEVNGLRVITTAYLGSMFYGCTSLTSVSMSTTSSVTDTSNMFYGCSSLVSVSLFTTSGVTSMTRMFFGCSSLTTVPLFNTGNVTSMYQMFRGCSSLTTVPTFNTSKVTNMSQAFQNCSSLQTVPLFTTSKVTNISEAFDGCYSVNSGAYALFVRMILQSPMPTYHSYTFQNCGVNSTSGSLELWGISSNWKTS